MSDLAWAKVQIDIIYSDDEFLKDWRRCINSLNANHHNDIILHFCFSSDLTFS